MEVGMNPRCGGVAAGLTDTGANHPDPNASIF
jgi:hypothetical protein